MQEKYCLGVPSDITIFRKLVENGSYIDKTMYLRRMLRGDHCYMLYLPHGWGKTLTCSMLKELFEGNKELFRGFDIYDWYDFEPYPVIYLDFRRLNVSETFDAFMDSFWNLIYEQVADYGFEPDTSDPQLLLTEAMFEKQYKTGQRAVILIDNYDSPLYRAIGKDFYEKMDRILELFYGSLKNFTGRFLLMTGVTKYLIRTLLGTGLYMNYVTNHFQYNGMLGYTEDEIINHFGDVIDKHMDGYHSREEFLNKLRRYYGGYRLNDKMEEPVYNPLSINRFMKNGCEFRSYWDDTEETEFASNIAKPLTDEELFKYPSISGSLNTFTVPTYEHESEYDSLTMLFFSGYLTVKEGSEYHILDLDFPNEEARNAFKVFIRKE